MSITGRNSKSIRKVDVKESKSLAQGFTKLVFAHKADLGETSVNLGSLTTPTEMSALGFTNPSPSRLTEAKLFQFKTNLTLVSSLRGVLMQDLSYRVNSNSSIRLEFQAEDGEIFTGIIDANPVNGIQVIDAKQAVAKGDLAVGDTDFAIGFSTKTDSEDIIVIRNGLVQTRNTNNSSTVEDGNYYVVDDNTDGYGNLIRFNVAPSGEADSILVVSLGGIVESPTNSTWDEIQKVQGQIDALVPTVADLAGVPETDFQATPNDVDLLQFGSRVVGLEEPGEPGVPKKSTITTEGAQLKNRIQTKILSSNVTSDGVISELTFNNLIIGKWYEVELQAALRVNSGGPDRDVALFARHNGIPICVVEFRGTSTSASGDLIASSSVKFQATADTLEILPWSTTSANSFIQGNGTLSRTYIQLEERNDLEETNVFS